MQARKLMLTGLSVWAAAVVMGTGLFQVPLARAESEQPPEEQARPTPRPQPFELQKEGGLQRQRVASSGPAGFAPVPPAPREAVAVTARGDHPFAIWDGTTDPRWAEYLAELKPSASMVMVPPLFFDKQSVQAGWPDLQKLCEEHIRLGIEFIPGNDLGHGELDMPLAEFDAAVRKAVRAFPKMPGIMIGCEADFTTDTTRRPRDYALRVRAAYRAVKAERPSCRVVVGGTGGMARSYARAPEEGFFGDPFKSVGYFDAVFAELERLERIEKNPGSYDWKANPLRLSKEEFALLFSADGYAGYQDVHHISLFVRDHRKYRDEEHAGVVRAVKALLFDYGYRNTEIWITQAGTHSGTIQSKFLAGPPQTEREQAASLVKQYLVYRSWGVKRIFWCSIVEMDWPEEFGARLGTPGNPHHYFSLVGLVHNGKGEGDPGHGVRKLAYHTYRFLVEKLGGADWDRLELVRDDEAVVFRLWVDQKPVYVAWREPTTPGPFTPLPPLLGQAGKPSVSISLPIDGKGASVTCLLPSAHEGNQIGGASPEFPTRRVEGVGGRVMLELSDEPVLVEPLSHAPANPSPGRLRGRLGALA